MLLTCHRAGTLVLKNFWTQLQIAAFILFYTWNLQVGVFTDEKSRDSITEETITEDNLLPVFALFCYCT